MIDIFFKMVVGARSGVSNVFRFARLPKIKELGAKLAI